MRQQRNSLGWLWFLPAVFLFIMGLVFALRLTTRQTMPSHPTLPDPYEKSALGVKYTIRMGTETGNIYINANGSSEYFVAFPADFNPPIQQSDINNSANVAFVARTDESSLNPVLDADGTTIYQAHKIVQFTLYDQSAAVLATYTTAEYTAYLASRNQSASPPEASFLNTWPFSLVLIIAGLLWIGCTVLVLLRRRQMRSRMMQPVGIYPYAESLPQIYQPSYTELPSPYDHLSRPYIAPPPPFPYASPNASSEQFGRTANQNGPTQYSPPPYTHEQ
ncbi:MAG TPA: hypothetical protein VFV38_21365 [Ktedonobacteraceae bacterium]|nr:hypothetical protein [Ktedonobacteraceae bacterium]